MLRNAADILPFLIGHYLRAGFDRVCFIDDGSTDGGFELLTAASERTSRVTAARHHSTTFDQERIVNAQVNALIAEGFSLVFPFDADEFWIVDVPGLLPRLEGFDRGCAIHGRWVNFVQARTPAAAPAAALQAIRHRVPTGDLASSAQVTGFTRGFVSVQLTKTAVLSRTPVVLSRGAHRFVQGPEARLPGELEIFHVPLRSPAEVRKRALDYEPRRAPLRPSETVSWQSRFFADAVREGLSGALWEANSADEHGALSLTGGAYPLVADPRFGDLAARALQRFEALGVASA